MNTPSPWPQTPLAELLDIVQTIELGLTRGYTPAELLDENSPVRDRIRAAIAAHAGSTCEDEGCPHYGRPHGHTAGVRGTLPAFDSPSEWKRRALAAEAALRTNGASAWWALVMGAAASIEDAANCLRDPDAKKQADGAAKHYREAAQKLMAAADPWWKDPRNYGMAEYAAGVKGPEHG